MHDGVCVSSVPYACHRLIVKFFQVFRELAEMGKNYVVANRIIGKGIILLSYVNIK